MSEPTAEAISRQHRYGGGSSILLSAAMVGYDNGGGTRLCCKLGIVEVEYAFQDELSRPNAANPVDVRPCERGIELMRDPDGQGAGGVGLFDVAG